MPLPLPLEVESIETHGKLLMWNLVGGWHIFCRAAMSGRWSQEKEKHNHICFSFSNGTQLFFNDARNFGTIKFGQAPEKTSILATLGIDVLREPARRDRLHLPGKERRKTIGGVLLDQSVFSGVGNYLRAEILYAAHVSPLRPLNSLSNEDWDRICEKTEEVTKLSYHNGGATIRTYQNLTGERGKFQERFLVYGRKTDPEGRPIQKQQDETGRSIWWCPSVQL